MSTRFYDGESKHEHFFDLLFVYFRCMRERSQVLVLGTWHLL